MSYSGWRNPARRSVCTGSAAFLLMFLAAGGCGADHTDDGVVVSDTGPDQTRDGGITDTRGATRSDTGGLDTASPNDADSRSDDDSTAPDPDAGDEPSPDTAGPPDQSPSDCTTTQKYCDDRCVDVLSDPDHCGSCGFSCNDTATCINGMCKCADGNIRCDGRCVDPTSNDDHCFKCGNACPDGQMCENSVCVEKNLQQAAIKYINQVRQTKTDCGQYGIKPPGPELTVNAELDKAAESYARRMADKGFFAHQDPYDGSDFIERVNRTNYRGTALGENLSRGLRQSAKRVVEGWRKSDAHCRVMTNPNATELGLGRAEPESGRYDAYWVLLTGRQ